MDKQDKNSFEDSLKAIARNRDFQVVMAEILARCNILEQPFNGNSRDIFHAGRRSVAIELLRELREADKQAAIEIMKGVMGDD